MDGEVRATAAPEIRVSGRTLAGTVMRYGSEALVPVRGEMLRERFEAGSFAPVPPVSLVMEHDDSLVIAKAGEYELRDSPEALTLRAELHEKSAALIFARRGYVSGYSFRFNVLEERREGSLRIVERGQLQHIGLVGSPAYAESTAELRARGARGGRLGTIRGRIPVGKTLDCRCAPGNCRKALFENGAFDDVLADDAREILAVAGDYSAAVASRKQGGIRFWMGKDSELEFAADISEH